MFPPSHKPPILFHIYFSVNAAAIFLQILYEHERDCREWLAIDIRESGWLQTTHADK